MKKFFIFAMMLSMAISAIAIPAKRGQWKHLTLADGSKVRATLVGDEFGHFWKTADDVAYMKVGECYKQIDGQKVTNRAKILRHQANAKRVQRLPESGVGSYFGQKKGLIILVNFKDVKFKTSHNNELFQKIANEEGYSEGKFKGSMADYFKAQSRGQFMLDFDIVGPVTVSKNAKYYGGNDADGNDMHAGEMVCEAVTKAKSEVSDWQQYDWNNDGYVDQVYIVYAGQGEADGGEDDTIWPHAYDLSSANYYGDGTGPVNVSTGLKVNTYACGSELNGNNAIEGIGTICHEFSHCLGYPDFYDVDYSGGQGMDFWDLMDQGSYNGDGYQPAGYTAYERWAAGWLTPIELDNEDMTVTNMKSLQNDGECYIIYNKGNINEFLMLENRQLEGWDASLNYGGLLITHCDYDQEVWAQNGPNDDPNHQRMVVVPADGRCQKSTYLGQTYYTGEGDAFPQRNVTSFNKNFKTYDNIAAKAAKFFKKNTNGSNWIDASIEGITQNADGTIAFNYVAGTNQGNQNDDNPLKPEGAIFYESFNQCIGTGGNDGLCSNSIANGEFVTDNDGWVVNIDGGRGYGASQCAKFGTGKARGDVTTPAFKLTGEAKLSFRAGAWNASSEGDILTISATGAEVSESTVTMEKGAFQDYELKLNGKGLVTLTFQSLSGSKSRFFLDEVLVMPLTTAAIETMGTTRSTGRIYTIDGRFLGTNKEALEHGIYIIDGKKIIK
jgi:M6 family metalloprotease-like protein